MDYLDRSEYAALVAAIRANPRDDLPRLALCDWLEELERDDATDHAEFIRTQIEIAKKQCRTCDEYADEPCHCEDKGRFDALRQREFQLLCHSEGQYDANWMRWCWAEDRDPENGIPRRKGRLGGFAGYPSPPSLGHDGYLAKVATGGWDGLIRQTFVRGFVGKLECSLAEWQRSGEEIVASQPIQQVILSDRWAYGSEFGFGWDYDISPVDQPNVLPGDVWERLPPCPYGAILRRGHYFSPLVAAKAVSYVLVGDARKKLGLPKLYIPEFDESL